MTEVSIQFFSVSPDEYEKFTQLPNDESIEQAPIILYYQHRGLLQPNDISVIQHPATAQAAGSI